MNYPTWHGLRGLGFKRSGLFVGFTRRTPDFCKEARADEVGGPTHRGSGLKLSVQSSLRQGFRV